ncbi:MAG: hypothetical protein IJ055_05460 [Oscillospiraceae bacterium]|nr:hypothetical protein [Oscillospiraceae bacterium]
MELLETYAYPLVLCIAGVMLLLYYVLHKKRIRSFLLGGVTGLASLLLLHLFGGGLAPTLCLANLCMSTLLGIPGTALIVLGQVTQ